MKSLMRSKLKDRFAILLAATLVCFTICLLLDIQLELNWATSAGHHINTKTNSVKNKLKNVISGLDNFPRQFLNLIATTTEPNELSVKRHTIRHNNINLLRTTTEKPSLLLSKIKATDRFDDLISLVIEPLDTDRSEKYGKIIVATSSAVRNELLPRNASDWLELGSALKNDTALIRFHRQINRYEMYNENSAKIINDLVDDIANIEIVKVIQKEGGTQLKLIMTYENDMQALFKPQRFSREHQTLPNHFYFSDFERHNAEIAAFHLDRVLGFRRAMPVVGRLLNITSEIFELADDSLLRTSFVSPAKNLCFHGKCSYYCDTGHAICGNPDTLEGSFAAFLPKSERKVWRHPWRRSYNKRKKAQWETDDEYCDMIREVSPYDEGRRLLDLMDMSIFDFLMGNMDRHHYETFRHFGNDTFTIHLDHGRGFGKPFHDEISILAPLLQCCQIRRSTLRTLLKYHNGSKRLSQALREAMVNDPIAPILWEPHFTAIDRRVVIILSGIRECVKKVNRPSVE